MKFRVLLLVVLFACGAMLVSAQKKINKVPAPHTSAASGKQMYEAYCASCHGADAKGNGPAASALKTAPSDLTSLKKQHDGQFPAMRVQSVIMGEVDMPAHGSKEMPVWGPVFRRISQGDQAQVKLRVDNVTDYIKSLQQ
jgi:mono/diheme cytochrome c family protein